MRAIPAMLAEIPEHPWRLCRAEGPYGAINRGKIVETEIAVSP
jgi:hypothetical protein